MDGEGALTQKIKDFTRQIFKGRDQLPANSQKKLDKWGDYEIEKVKIVRKPIMSGITKLADKLTKGKFTKDMAKNGFDDLFHLRLDIFLKGSVCITIEKNETVTISRGKCESKNVDGLETRIVEVKKPITLKEAYDKMTRGYPTKKNLYDYDSLKNNCQRFVDTFLTQNKDAFNYTSEDKKFVKQDLKFIIDKYSKLKKPAKIITNIAQRLSLFMTGGADSDEEMKDLTKEMEALSVIRPSAPIPFDEEDEEEIKGFKVPTREDLIKPHLKDYKKPKSQRTFYRPAPKRPNQQKEEKKGKRKTETDITKPQAKRGGIDLSEMFANFDQKGEGDKLEYHIADGFIEMPKKPIDNRTQEEWDKLRERLNNKFHVIDYKRLINSEPEEVEQLLDDDFKRSDGNIEYVTDYDEFVPGSNIYIGKGMNINDMIASNDFKY